MHSLFKPKQIKAAYLSSVSLEGVMCKVQQPWNKSLPSSDARAVIAASGDVISTSA